MAPGTPHNRATGATDHLKTRTENGASSAMLNSPSNRVRKGEKIRRIAQPPLS